MHMICHSIAGLLSSGPSGTDRYCKLWVSLECPNSRDVRPDVLNRADADNRICWQQVDSHTRITYDRKAAPFRE